MIYERKIVDEENPSEANWQGSKTSFKSLVWEILSTIDRSKTEGEVLESKDIF